MDNPYFTIGHSTHTIEAFVDLLRPEQVSLVVDVRTVPRSRTNPQFNRDTLPASLAGFQIGYEHVPELAAFAEKDSMSPRQTHFGTTRASAIMRIMLSRPPFTAGSKG